MEKHWQYRMANGKEIEEFTSPEPRQEGKTIVHDLGEGLTYLINADQVSWVCIYDPAQDPEVQD